MIRLRVAADGRRRRGNHSPKRPAVYLVIGRGPLSVSIRIY